MSSDRELGMLLGLAVGDGVAMGKLPDNPEYEAWIARWHEEIIARFEA